MPLVVLSPHSSVLSPLVDTITRAQWEALFPDHPDSFDMVRLTQSAGIDGFTFRHIVVREGDLPVLLLPLFEVRLELADLVGSKLARLVRLAARLMPGVLAPRLLGVGFVEGEWGEVGFRRDIDAATLAKAWETALAALTELGRQLKSDLTVLLNFTPGTLETLPPSFVQRFASIPTYPCGRLAITFENLEDYLRALSRPTRKDLNRKLRAAAGIEIRRTRDPAPWLDTIYHLYCETVKRSDLAFGLHRRAWFERVCAEVAGAHFVLYIRGDELLAFNLLVERDGQLVDKYFCMDEPAGREMSLYFVSWAENVRHCCEAGLNTYHAGPGAEETKGRLGARLVPVSAHFRARNPVTHQLLRALRPLLAYKPARATEPSYATAPGRAAPTGATRPGSVVPVPPGSLVTVPAASIAEVPS